MLKSFKCIVPTLINSSINPTLCGLMVFFFIYREEMFTKLAKQIIWQRCLHPSYVANPNVPVDHLLWLEHCTLQQNTPHIILTSSQLRTFIRVMIITC